jgi:PIN domain nuclease of toxin-antitoxin system
MKYLVDTYILLWSFFDTKKISKGIQSVLLDENNDIYYSPVNLWEISIKYGLKKLDLKGYTPETFYDELDNSYYLYKEVNRSDIITNYTLPLYHKDPFDRFIIWESIRNDFVLLSADNTIEQYRNAGLKVII